MLKIIPETQPDEIDKWLEPEKHANALRLAYIKTLQSHIPNRCPNCKTELTIDEEQIYCPKCGLITQDSYDYQAGIHFKLPHGLKLM